MLVGARDMDTLLQMIFAFPLEFTCNMSCFIFFLPDSKLAIHINIWYLIINLCYWCHSTSKVQFEEAYMLFCLFACFSQKTHHLSLYKGSPGRMSSALPHTSIFRNSKDVILGGGDEHDILIGHILTDLPMVHRSKRILDSQEHLGRGGQIQFSIQICVPCICHGHMMSLWMTLTSEIEQPNSEFPGLWGWAQCTPLALWSQN